MPTDKEPALVVSKEMPLSPLRIRLNLTLDRLYPQLNGFYHIEHVLEALVVMGELSPPPTSVATSGDPRHLTMEQ